MSTVHRWSVALLMLCLIVPLQGSEVQAAQSQRSPTAQPTTTLVVKAVRKVEAIRHERRSHQYGSLRIEEATLTPDEGRCFVAVELVTSDKDAVRFSDNELVLRDATGGKYGPIGAELSPSSPLPSYRPFDDTFRSASAFASDGTGRVEAKREQPEAPVGITMAGAGVDCIIYFDVPENSEGASLRTPDGHITTLSGGWDVVPVTTLQGADSTSPLVAPPEVTLTRDLPATVRVSEELLGQINPGIRADTLTISPDGNHVAYVARRDSKWSVFVDGSAGHSYDAIADAGLVFSEDGSRFAYAARKENRYVVVTDGIAGKAYDAIGQASLVFSPDCRRLAFTAREGQRNFVVINGTESNAYEDGVGGLLFSPDSKHMAYVASRGSRQCVVIDGVEKAWYKGLVAVDPGGQAGVFSRDGRHFAYAAERGHGQMVIVDDTEGMAYDAVWRPVFSPDGRHIAYVARKAGRHVVVVDGVEQKDYDAVGQDSLVFSPDSRHLAYGAQRGGDQLVVVDRVEHAPYDGVYGLVFSADGNRLAYIGRRGEERVVIVDRSETASYNNIDGVTFSPDNKRIAYAARSGDRWVAVVNGLEEKEYGSMGAPVFSPDSESIAYVANQTGRWLIVINGKEIEARGTPLRGAELVFDNSASLRTLWHRNGTIFRAHMSIQRAP